MIKINANKSFIFLGLFLFNVNIFAGISHGNDATQQQEQIENKNIADKEKLINQVHPSNLPAKVEQPRTTDNDASDDASTVEQQIEHLSKEGSASLHGMDPHAVLNSVNTIPANIQKDATQTLRQSMKESPAAVRAYQQYMQDANRQKELEQYRKSVLNDSVTDATGNAVNKDSVDEYIRKNSDQTEYTNKYIVVFISASMPVSTIKTFMEVYGDNPYTVFVLRGVIDNDISRIKPTVRWIRQFTCAKESDPQTCHQAPIDINPDLFKRFKISQVPAVLYTPLPASLATACDGPINIKDNDFLVVYGDAEPFGPLDAFLRERPDDLQLKAVIKSIIKDAGNLNVPKS